MTAKEMENKFCKRIHKLRNKEKLSLAELARRSGLPPEMLEALERGTILEEMMVDDAFALARVFHCEIYELFE